MEVNNGENWKTNLSKVKNLLWKKIDVGRFGFNELSSGLLNDWIVIWFFLYIYFPLLFVFLFFYCFVILYFIKHQSINTWYHPPKVLMNAYKNRNVYNTVCNVISLYNKVWSGFFFFCLMAHQLSCGIKFWNCPSKSGVMRGFITFPQGISLKVNIIAQLEFELVYHGVAFQHISHFSRGSSPPGYIIKYIIYI